MMSEEFSSDLLYRLQKKEKKLILWIYENQARHILDIVDSVWISCAFSWIFNIISVGLAKDFKIILRTFSAVSSPLGIY